MGQEQTYPFPFAPTTTPFSNYKETLHTVDRKFQVLDGCIKEFKGALLCGFLGFIYIMV